MEGKGTLNKNSIKKFFVRKSISIITTIKKPHFVPKTVLVPAPKMQFLGRKKVVPFLGGEGKGRVMTKFFFVQDIQNFPQVECLGSRTR